MRVTLAMATLAIASSGALGQQYVRPGGTVSVGFFATIKNDCSSNGRPAIDVVQSPHMGTLEVKSGKGFLQSVAPSLKVACNAVAVPGTNIVYKAAPDATGLDTFTFVVSSLTGRPRRITRFVSIR